jgi:hypothetical protein
MIAGINGANEVLFVAGDLGAGMAVELRSLAV